MRVPLFEPTARAMATWLCVVLTFASFALADVKFVKPEAGGDLKAGLIDVQWEDSGISPPISELTQYTLSLMVGGNEDDEMQPISTFESDGSYSRGDSTSGTIPEGIAADIENGFFFRMTSTKEAGGVVINYSDRFSISGLSGETALKIRQAAQDLDGNTDGPPSVGNDESSSSTFSSASTKTPTSSTSNTATRSSAATSSSSSSSSSSSPTESTPSSSSSSSSADSSSSNLSKGATAGLAVGVILAVLALTAGLMSYLYVKRRKKQNEVQEILPGNPFQQHHQHAMSELSTDELVRPKTVWTHHTELSSESMVHEAGAGERPPELDHMAFRAELEGCSPVSPVWPLDAKR